MKPRTFISAFLILLLAVSGASFAAIEKVDLKSVDVDLFLLTESGGIDLSPYLSLDSETNEYPEDEPDAKLFLPCLDSAQIRHSLRTEARELHSTPPEKSNLTRAPPLA